MEVYRFHKISCSIFLLVFSIIAPQIKSEKKSYFKLSYSVSKGVAFGMRSIDCRRYLGRSRGMDDGLKMVLFNSRNQNGTTIKNPKNLLSSHFDYKKPVKIFIHGWYSSGDSQTSLSVKDAYIDNRDVNMLVLHWENYSQNIYYAEVVQSALNIVVNFTVDFIKMMCDLKITEPRNIHLIGHSLGAHLSGMTGKNLSRAGYRIGRITGLDPALPGFRSPQSEKKLSMDDADFVEIIHTSGKWIGIDEPMGHVDFYPNGGHSPMPGCGFWWSEICSHSRSWQYYAESIYNPMFATKCRNFDEFKNKQCSGEVIRLGREFIMSRRPAGRFYFLTDRKPPFSLGRMGITYSN